MQIHINYLNDFNEYFLGGYYDGLSPYQPYHALGYLPNRKLTKCPGTDDYTVETSNGDYYGYASKGSSVLFTVNSLFLGASFAYPAGQTARKVATINAKTIKQPSIYFQNGDSRFASGEHQASLIYPGTAGNYPRFAMVHQNRMNANFLDGHAGTMNPEEYVDCYLRDWTWNNNNGSKIYWMDQWNNQRNSAWLLYRGL